MSEHNARRELADSDPGILSETTGELLEARYIWGAHYIIKASNGNTRKLVEPGQLGQKIQMSGNIASGAFTVTAPAGTTFDGTNTTLTFTFSSSLAASNLWVTLESVDVGGVLNWRVTSKGSGVTLTT